jgi:TfoX/Sxy family transcriptional regulator of competence genes
VEIPKASDQDKARFRSLVPDDPGIIVKPMFGNLGAFVNGNMFAGLFGATVGVRLSDEDRSRLEQVEGTGPFGPQGRPMGGYLGLPEARASEPDHAAAWVARAHVHVSGLPPQAPKAPGPPTPAEPAVGPAVS